jgi:hypothetical protein
MFIFAWLLQMSRVEHYCPKAGPIFVSAWLLQMSIVEHYCSKAGPIFQSTSLAVICVFRRLARGVIRIFCGSLYC